MAVRQEVGSPPSEILIVVFDDSTMGFAGEIYGALVPSQIDIMGETHTVRWHPEWNACGTDDAPDCVQVDELGSFQEALEWCVSFKGKAICFFDYDLGGWAIRLAELAETLQQNVGEFAREIIDGSVRTVGGELAGSDEAGDIDAFYSSGRQGLVLALAMASNAAADTDIVLNTATMGVKEVSDQHVPHFATLAGPSRRVASASVLTSLTRADAILAAIRSQVLEYVEHRNTILHPDPLIASILAAYGRQFEADNGKRRAWSHNVCEKPPALRVGAGIVGLKLDRMDGSINKALFKPPNLWFGQEAVDRFYAVAPLVLELFLERRLLIESKWTGFGEENVTLPCKPGVAFFLSLRELLNELVGVRQIAKVEFRRDEFNVALHINLGEHKSDGGSIRRGGYGAVRAFLKKLRTMKNDLGMVKEDAGLSTLISNLACCKLDRVGNTGNLDWVTMFEEGAKGWAMWPSFLEDGIEFSWSVDR